MDAIKNEQTKADYTSLSTIQHVLFLSAIFCFWFSTYIYIPSFGVYMENIGLSYSSIGIILGAYGISQVILRFPLGILLEWLDRSKKIWLIFGFIMAVLSGALLILFDHFSMILLARIFAGVTASMWVMATIMYGQFFPIHQSTKAMSTMQFVTVFTQFISMVLCGILIQKFGWEFPFWIASLSACLGAILLLFVPEKREKSNRSTSFSTLFMQTIRIKNLMTISILSILGHAILFITIFGFSPIYAVNNGYGEQAITWLVYAFFIPHALTSLAMAFFHLDPKFNRLSLNLGFACSMICLLWIPFSSSMTGVLVAHIGIGLALGIVFPILLGEAASISSVELKLPTMGFYQSLYALGIFLGPIIAGGIASSASLEAVFYFASILALLGILILSFGTYKSSPY